MTSLSLQIDPHAVLGVGAAATLQEIREAYRRKAKTYHPDSGGEEWAFRVLVQAYESLSTERVARATRAEFRKPAPAYDDADHGRQQAPTSEPPRDPERVVEIEKLWIRTDAGQAWDFLSDANDDRLFLSCSLNVRWPSGPVQGGAAGEIPNVDGILAQLAGAFQEVAALTPGIPKSKNVEDHRFYGCLSYPNVKQAWEAFRRLREALQIRGFSVKDWTRELTVPRHPR